MADYILDSTLALSTLEYNGSQVVVTHKGQRVPAPVSKEMTWFKGSISELPYNENMWEAVYKLIELPWFSRLWACKRLSSLIRIPS